jgi:outer membrane protein
MLISFGRQSILTVIAVVLCLGNSAAFAVEKGDWLLRLRGIGIVPTDDSSSITPDLLTSGLDPQAAIVPEIDITYMVTKNIGIELIAATSKHDFDGLGPALGGLDGVAEAWLLPPTLLLQYHFLPDGKFRPYVGAGINYTITYAENAQRSLENILGPTKVTADNSLGWAVQAGFDYELNERWFLNFDVKYITINVDMKLDSGGTIRRIDQGIDPVVIGVGIGYRF